MGRVLPGFSLSIKSTPRICTSSRINFFNAAISTWILTCSEWFGTINNLTQKGLRSDELDRSGLIEFLVESADSLAPITGKALAQAVEFSALRLSVIANINEARTQLRFETVTKRRLAKIKGKAKPQAGQQRRLHLFDRVMGYCIERVQHTALWGDD